MLRKALIGLVVLLASAFAGAQQGPSPFSNLQDIIAKNNFSPYYNLKPVEQTRIAVFDASFTGYEADQGKYLPSSGIEYSAGTAPDIKDSHGKYMAEIIYALMTNEGRSPQLAPKFYFYRVNGFTDFQAAITDAIRNKVQIISESVVQNFGSNWDGQGFWNQEVNRATSAGIIWVNDAGDLARQTYNSPEPGGKAPGFTFNDNSFVNLPDANNSLSFTCQPNRPGTTDCDVEIFLTWNDFKNDRHVGTAKDLNLLLIDSSNQKARDVHTNKELESALVQTPVTIKDDENTPMGKSLYPREHITGTIRAGTYYLMINSPNAAAFSAGDKLRITMLSETATLTHYDISESLLNPADNPTVITVGALDSERTGVSQRLSKPELIANSIIKLTTNIEYAGSSNSTAIVAAGFGLLMSQKPNMNRQDLLNATKSDPVPMDAVFSLPQQN